MEPTFPRLKLNYRCPLTDWYTNRMFETKRGYLGSPHIFWTGPVTQYGYPGHLSYGKIMAVNAYILYKAFGFKRAPDEYIHMRCGITNCLQTAHMVVKLKSSRPVPAGGSKKVLDNEPKVLSTGR